jgi:hypothetical protein
MQINIKCYPSLSPIPQITVYGITIICFLNFRSRRPSMSPAPEIKPIEEAPKISFGLRPRLIQAGSEFKLLTCVQSTPVPKVNCCFILILM